MVMTPSGRQGQGHGGVDGLIDILPLLGAVVLGDDHRGPRGDAHKEVTRKLMMMAVEPPTAPRAAVPT